MNEQGALIARIAARSYAILAALGGVAILGVVALLISAFGTRGMFELKFLTFIVLPGIAGIALAWPIWRQRTWAMLAALGVAVMLTFLFSMESGLLHVALPGAAALFALFTGVHIWLGRPA